MDCVMRYIHNECREDCPDCMGDESRELAASETVTDWAVLDPAKKCDNTVPISETPTMSNGMVSPIALARAMFIHVCPPIYFDAGKSWDDGTASRQSWIDMATRVITEMGWKADDE
jgi:hypothetical protein